MRLNFRAFIELTKFSDSQPEHSDPTARPDSEPRQEKPHFELGTASWPLIVSNHVDARIPTRSSVP